MPIILPSQSNSTQTTKRLLLKQKQAAIALHTDAQGHLIAPKPNMRFVKMGPNKELLFTDEEDQLYFLSAENYNVEQFTLTELNDKTLTSNEHNASAFNSLGMQTNESNFDAPAFQNVALNDGDGSSRGSYGGSSIAKAGWFVGGTALAIVSVGVVSAVAVGIAINKLLNKKKDGNNVSLDAKPLTINKEGFDEIKEAYKKAGFYSQTKLNEETDLSTDDRSKMSEIDVITNKHQNTIVKYVKTSVESLTKLTLINATLSNAEAKIKELAAFLQKNAGHVQSSVELAEQLKIKDKALRDKLKWFQEEGKKALVEMEKVDLKEKLDEINTLNKDLPQISIMVGKIKNEDFFATVAKLQTRIENSLFAHLNEDQKTDYSLEYLKNIDTYQISKFDMYTKISQHKASDTEKANYVTTIYHDLYKKFSEMAKKNIEDRNKELNADTSPAQPKPLAIDNKNIDKKDADKSNDKSDNKGVDKSAEKSDANKNVEKTAEKITLFDQSPANNLNDKLSATNGQTSSNYIADNKIANDETSQLSLY